MQVGSVGTMGGGAARGEQGWGAGPEGIGRGTGGREAGGKAGGGGDVGAGKQEGGGELISKSQMARGATLRSCKKPKPKITDRKGCPLKGFCIK